MIEFVAPHSLDTCIARLKSQDDTQQADNNWRTAISILPMRDESVRFLVRRIALFGIPYHITQLKGRLRSTEDGSTHLVGKVEVGFWIWLLVVPLLILWLISVINIAVGNADLNLFGALFFGLLTFYPIYMFGLIRRQQRQLIEIVARLNEKN